MLALGAACAALLLGHVGHAAQRHDTRDEFGFTRSISEARGAADGGIAGAGCAAPTITQSSSPGVIEPASAFWCGSLTLSAANEFARSFGVQPDGTSVTCVEFGIDRNVGGAWPVEIVLYAGTISSPSSLVELFSTSIDVPEGTATTFFSTSFAPVAIPDGEPLVVSLRIASRVPVDGGDGGLLVPGFNDDGQTAPTWLRAPACGESSFVDGASIGFPNAHLVMTVGLAPAADPLLFGGFLHEPLGGASLALVEGDLLISGPTSGFGVRHEVGDASRGASTGLLDWPVESGARIDVTFEGPGAIDTLSLVEVDGALRLDTDLASPDWQLFDVLVLDGDDLVDILSGLGSGDLSVAPLDPLGASSAVCFRVTCIPDPPGTATATGGSYSSPIFWKSAGTSPALGPPVTSVSVFSAPGGASIVGDGFVLRPSMPGGAGMPGPTAVTVFTSGVEACEKRRKDPPSVFVGDATTLAPFTASGLLTTPAVLAQAAFDAGAQFMQGTDLDADGIPELRVQPAMSDGSTAVVLPLGDVRAARIAIALDDPAMPASVNVGGDNDDDKNGGGTSVLLAPGVIEHAFLALDAGAPAPFLVEAMQDGAVVATFDGVNDLAVGTTDAWPDAWSFASDSALLVELSFPDGTVLLPAGGGDAITIDRLRSVSTGAVSDDRTMNLTIATEGTSGWTLTDVATAVGCDGQAVATDGGFETLPLGSYGAVVGDFPGTAGTWGAEVGAIVGTENGITPAAGSNMLRMSTDGLVVTQTVQAIDVSALASTIDTGSLEAAFAAQFNVPASVSAGIAYTAIRTFSGSTYSTLVSTTQTNVNLDADPATWELHETVGRIPPGTRWLILEIGYSNASIGTQPGYVDEAELCIRPLTFDANCRVYWAANNAGSSRIDSAGYGGTGRQTFRTAGTGTGIAGIDHLGGSPFTGGEIYWREGALLYRDNAQSPGTPTVVSAFPCVSDYSEVVAFSPTIQYFGCSTSVQVWRVANGTPSQLPITPAQIGTLRALALDGAELLIGASTGTILRWDGSSVTTHATIPPLGGQLPVILAMDVDPVTRDVWVLGVYTAQLIPDRPFLSRVTSGGTVVPVALNAAGGGHPLGFLGSTNPGVAVDSSAGFVWWTCRSGASRSEVRRLPIAGGQPMVMFTAASAESFTELTVSRCEQVTLVGDLTGDGVVDAADLTVLLGSWGPCGACEADLDGDGAVGAADLTVLLGNWG